MRIKKGKNCRDSTSIKRVSIISLRSRLINKRKGLLRKQDRMPGKKKAHAFDKLSTTEPQKT